MTVSEITIEDLKPGDRLETSLGKAVVVKFEQGEKRGLFFEGDYVIKPIQTLARTKWWSKANDDPVKAEEEKKRLREKSFEEAKSTIEEHKDESGSRDRLALSYLVTSICNRYHDEYFPNLRERDKELISEELVDYFLYYYRR